MRRITCGDSGNELTSKNVDGSRDPELHQTKKEDQHHIVMKANLRVNAESGLAHTLMTTAANAQDVAKAQNLLHGKETDVHADSGYRGIRKECRGKGSASELAYCNNAGQAPSIESGNDL